MKMTLATEDDVGRIMSLIEDCIRDMESQGVYQWSENYPNLKIVEDDVQTKSMYKMKENEEVMGVITLNEKQSPEWATIPWSSHGVRTLVIHRLAVDPRWQKQGIGRRLLNFAEKYAKDNGYKSIRLDTYSGNTRALRLYENAKYKRVGEVHFPGRDLPFYCYEKILRK